MNGQTAGSDAKALVLQATDIVELIGQSVALKRRGKDFVGLCPFHQEKTPSFHVSPSRQFFHCYGCKVGGNAIDFVIRRDRVEFIDALTILADRAGIELPRFSGARAQTGDRQKLLEANSAACAFFEKLLAHPQLGQAARKYLDERNINAESVRRFQIGVAPDGWDGLLKSAVGRKFGQETLLKAGLVRQRATDSGASSGAYDVFRNRLIFPIRDESGRMIGFGGRVLPGSDDPAKYLNSPETPLFSKGRCIFGLDLARQRTIETGTVAVVEGYTDVVMAHQHGVTNVVSVLGTALTEQHVQILRRFAERIVLLFDADVAGDAAVNRAVQLFLSQPVEITIASMPQGVDPDEYLIDHGAEGFEKLLAAATDVLTFKWKELNKRFSAANDLTGQQRAVQEYMETLSVARGSGPVDPLRWGGALTRVSRLTDIPVAELNRRFRIVRVGARSTAKESRTEKPTTSAPAAVPTWTARDRAERWLLGLVLLEPQHWQHVQQRVVPEEFTEDRRRRLAETYWTHQQHVGEPVFNEFLGHLDSPELTELAVELVEEVENLSDRQATLTSALTHLEESRRRQDQKKLMSELRRTNDQPLDEHDQVSLLRQLQEKAGQPDLRRVGS